MEEFYIFLLGKVKVIMVLLLFSFNRKLILKFGKKIRAKTLTREPTSTSNYIIRYKGRSQLRARIHPNSFDRKLHYLYIIKIIFIYIL